MPNPPNNSPYHENAPDVAPSKYPYSVILRPEGIPPFRLSGNRPLEEFAVDFMKEAYRARQAILRDRILQDSKTGILSKQQAR